MTSSGVRTSVSLFLVTLGAVAVFQVLAAVLNLDAELAALLAAPILSAHPTIDQSLKQGTLRLQRPTWPKDVVPMEGFTLRWYVMFVYGALLFVAPYQLAAYVVPRLLPRLSLSNVLDLQTRYAALLGLGLAGATIVYLIGNWIGSRCDQFGILVVIAVAVTNWIAGTSITVLGLWVGAYENTFGAVSFGHISFILALSWLLLWVLSGLIGYWRGRKRRISQYLDYLLSRLSPEDQKALLSMAYEGAQKRSA